MRWLLPLLMLTACGGTPEQILTGVAALNIGSIAVIQRTPADALVSVASGKDCSVVRLEQGKTYCRPVEPPPEPPAFCTRSLGVADCWRDPASLPDHPSQVGDGPNQLTPEQNANRLRGWPAL